MKRIFNILISTLIITFVFLISSCHNNNNKGKGELEKKVYTCSMHPQIIRYEPGNCPICGMILVEKKAYNYTDSSSFQTDSKKNTNGNNADVKTVSPIQKAFNISIKSDGYITYSQENIIDINSRYSGRIEKLYVKFIGQQVKKGQILFDIYSPELISEQENLIYLLKNDNQNTSLIEASKQKLKFLGLTETQLQQIVQTKNSFHSLSVFSSADGYIIKADEQAQKNMSLQNKNNMNAKPELEKPSKEQILKEGDYIEKGEKLFRIANNNKLWAVIYIASKNLNYIKIHQPVEISFPDKSNPNIPTSIDFIEPLNVNEKNTYVARIKISNDKNNIKVGQLINATVNSGNVNGLWIPSSAVFDQGSKHIVFIKNKNMFETKTIKIGFVSNNMTEVIFGINQKDIIAENALLLNDSDEFIKNSENENE